MKEANICPSIAYNTSILPDISTNTNFISENAPKWAYQLYVKDEIMSDLPKATQPVK